MGSRNQRIAMAQEREKAEQGKEKQPVTVNVIVQGADQGQNPDVTIEAKGNAVLVGGVKL